MTGRWPFPQTRLRRLRRTAVLRDLVRETRLDAGDLVLPLFVEAGLERPRADRRDARRRPPRRSRPPSRRRAARRRSASPPCCSSASPADKDDEGSGAWDDEGVVQLATRAIKDAHPDLLVITDVCLCEYTEPRPLRPAARRRPRRQRRRRVELLARTAVSQARAGRRRRRAQRHDGRPRRRDPRRARRRGPRRHADHGLQREVRLRLLRPVPRGGRLDARLRRPPRLPDGPGQRRRGACARRCSTSRRAPTSSWSSRRCPTST